MNTPTPLEASSAPKHGKGPLALVAAAVLILIGLLVIGILPRLKQRSALAEGVKEVKTNLPLVTVAKPKFVPEPGISLPGNLEAFKSTTLNARTTGYLRELYVDIGSHVKAGQLLGIIQSPDVDQQLYQAQAQTAQARATVGQSQATVAQQQATVAQDKADVAHNRAAVQQARAVVANAQAQLAQAQATEKGTEAALAHAKQALQVQIAMLKQALAQLELAKVTNDRYQALLKTGYVALQDADQAEETYKADLAAVESAKASVSSAQADVVTAEQNVESAKAVVVAAQANVQSNIENVRAAEATLVSSQATVDAAQHAVRADVQTVHANQAAVTSNVANTRRFAVMRGFEKVIAPFTGVITARNVDVGTLISAGGTETGVITSAPTSGMLGIARTDVMRIQVNVPQTYVISLSQGSKARVTVRELPGRVFSGDVSLRAGALDTTSRTQLVEVHVKNPDGILVPGMYAEVKISLIHPPMILHIPGTALVVDANGTRVVIVGPDNVAHYQKVVVGRDMGTEVEIVSGLQGNERLVNNPSDTLQDDTKVQIVKAAPDKKGASRSSKKSSE